MALEPVSTAAMFGLALALVEVIKKLVEKLTAKKEDSDAPSLKSVDSKVDRCAEALARVASSLERQADTLERVEARIEKINDATIETRLRLVDGHNAH